MHRSLLITLVIALSLSQVPSDLPYILRKQTPNQTCQEAIGAALLDYTDLADAFYILSSGKYLDNWGAYNSCLQSAHGVYWMVSVSGNVVVDGTTVATTFRTGLCVPEGCSALDLSAMTGLFMQTAEFNNMEANSIAISFMNMNENLSERRQITKSWIILIVVAVLWLGIIGAGTLVSIT